MDLGWEPDDVAAVVDELRATFGEEALSAVDRALARTASAFGRSLRQRDHGETSPDRFVQHFVGEPAGPSAVLEASDQHAVLRTTRCPIAEVFRGMGRPEVGYRFKCQQDFHIASGYDPSMELQIRKCLMTGDDACIHEYRKERD